MPVPHVLHVEVADTERLIAGSVSGAHLFLGSGGAVAAHVSLYGAYAGEFRQRCRFYDETV